MPPEPPVVPAVLPVPAAPPPAWALPPTALEPAFVDEPVWFVTEMFGVFELEPCVRLPPVFWELLFPELSEVISTAPPVLWLFDCPCDWRPAEQLRCPPPSPPAQLPEVARDVPGSSSASDKAAAEIPAAPQGS